MVDACRGVSGKPWERDCKATLGRHGRLRKALRAEAGRLIPTASDAIRSLTNNQRLVELARRLHIAGPLKSWEYRLRGPRDGVIRHEIAGVEVMLAAPDAAEFRTFEDCYRDEMDFIEALANNLGKGGAFYDIGSNAGQFLIPMAKLVGERGQAIGFEPDPGNHERLVRNIALNRLTNVQAFRVALADCPGEIQMFGGRGTATVVPRAAIYNRTRPTSTVQAMRGDDLRRVAGLPIPRALKIDVEGAEFAVLSGLKETLSSSSCELLCCEIHPLFFPTEVSTEMVFSLVRSLGFNRTESRPRGSEIHLIAEKVEA
jgi:FkbM family methyltransferase